MSSSPSTQYPAVRGGLINAGGHPYQLDCGLHELDGFVIDLFDNLGRVIN